MRCIFCGHGDSKVVDSRTTIENNSIRRRRECINCGKRWTTYETVEEDPILVIKKNGSIQPFDKSKIKQGVLKACEKRPVSLQDIDKIASDVERYIKESAKNEVESIKIGEMVMDMLKRLDKIAYIRFASVYREFVDADSLVDFIRDEI